MEWVTSGQAVEVRGGFLGGSLVSAFNTWQYYCLLSVWPEPQFPHLCNGAAAALFPLEGEFSGLEGKTGLEQSVLNS